MDYVCNYGLRCDCEKSISKPKRRIISDGRIIYGFECQNCGRFQTKSAKSFGGNLPSEFTDKSLAEKFSERFREHLNKQSESRRSEWRERYDAYIQSQAWAKKREITLKRDNYTCQSCLQKQACHVHHLSYDRLGNEPLWDLASVCIDCHRALHPHMQKQDLPIDWDSFNSGNN